MVAAADQPPTVHPIAASGDVAATRWGDLVAVASDSGVTFYDPLGRRTPAFVRLSDKPRALAFSPSGHRIYVARRSVPGLAVVDRFERKELDGVVISTPDHVHYLPAMPALQHGLDVYCEKPLTHTVAQARALQRTAAAKGLAGGRVIRVLVADGHGVQARLVGGQDDGVAGGVVQAGILADGLDEGAGEELLDGNPDGVRCLDPGASAVEHGATDDLRRGSAAGCAEQLVDERVLGPRVGVRVDHAGRG